MSRPTLRDPRRILLLRPRAAGDVLLATPILRALRERFPSAQIAFGVRRNMLPLVSANPHADEVLVIDAHEEPSVPAPQRWLGTAAFLARVRAARFDWAIDLHGGPRSALVAFATGAPVRVGYDTPGRRYAYTLRRPRFERDADGKSIVRSAVRVNAAMLEPLAVPVRDDSLVLRVPPAASERIGRELAALRSGGAPDAGRAPTAGRSPDAARERGAAAPTAPRPLVLVNPAAKWATKAWEPERYARVAARLAADRAADVLVLWGPGERAVAERVVARAAAPRVRLAPAGDLGDVAALVAEADLVVGTDSGVSHIAAALGTPSVTLFGPTNPAEWHPYDLARHRPIHHQVPCSFCNFTACAWHACMTELPTERVVDAAAGLLAEWAGRGARGGVTRA